ATEFTRNLRPLLNAYGNDPRFTLVAFTLDESTYSRELAPLAGHYPALRLGPPWWFHDSIEGMRRFRERTTETAGIYKTAGSAACLRSHPRVLLDSRPPRPGPPRGRELPRGARRASRHRQERRTPDGAGARLRPGEADLQA